MDLGLVDVVLFSLFVFQAKHLLCDFVLQTSDQIQSKGHYLRAGGIIHAGLHAIGSIPALMVLTRAPELIGALIIFEFLLHYHVDYTKARLDAALRFSNTSTIYWTIFGTDQMVHQLTYLSMVYLVLHIGPVQPIML